MTMAQFIEAAFDANLELKERTTNPYPIYGPREEFRFESSRAELFVSLPTNPFDIDGCYFGFHSRGRVPFQHLSSNPLKGYLYVTSDDDARKAADFMVRALFRLGYDVDTMCVEHGLYLSSHEKEALFYNFRELVRSAPHRDEPEPKLRERGGAELPPSAPKPTLAPNFAILRGFRYKTKRFATGDEMALLQANPTAQELADWRERKLIGDPSEVPAPSKRKPDRDLLTLAAERAEVEEKVKDSWTDCEVGDYATYEALQRYLGLGKFYKMNGDEYCDMPTASFKADEGGEFWERIE